MSAKNQIQILAIWTVFGRYQLTLLSKIDVYMLKMIRMRRSLLLTKKIQLDSLLRKMRSAYAFFKRWVRGLIYISNDSVCKDDHVPVKKSYFFFNLRIFGNSNFQKLKFWTLLMKDMLYIKMTVGMSASQKSSTWGHLRSSVIKIMIRVRSFLRYNILQSSQ